MRYTKLRGLAGVGASKSATLSYSTYLGESYLVVPVIAMVGNSVVWPVSSDSPEFVPIDVLTLGHKSWNGRPVCLNHPKLDGSPVSANDPKTLEENFYGHTFNAYIEDNKLKLEAWLSLSRAQVLGAEAVRTIERLQSGEIVEISIGNFVAVDDVAGEYNGKEYSGSWEVSFPDHLAILPEGYTGACSVEMGCGALRINSSGQLVTELETLILSQARTPTYSGTESTTWAKPSFTDYIKYLHPSTPGSSSAPASVSKCSMDLRRLISSHSLLGDPEASNITELAYFPCVNPANGKLNESALRAIIKKAEKEDESGGNDGPSSQALLSAQDMARRLLNSEFAANLETNEAKTKMENEDKTNDKKPNLVKRLMSSLSSLIKTSIGNNELRAKLCDELKEIESAFYWVVDEDVTVTPHFVIYTTIIHYGDDYYYDPSKTEVSWWKRTFSLDESGQIQLNNDRTEIELGEREYREVKTETETEVDLTLSDSSAHSTHPDCKCKNKGEGTMTNDEKGKIVARIVGNSASPFKTSDMKALEALSEEALKGLDQKFSVEAKEGEDNKAKEKIAEVTASSSSETVVAPKTADQWLAEAPAEIRSLVGSYQAEEATRRTSLVTSLSAASAFTPDQLNAMPTPTLTTLAKSLRLDQVAVADYSASRLFNDAPVSANSEYKLPDTWGITAPKTN